MSTKPRVKAHPESLDGSDLYAAESILDQKVDSEGRITYLVKWSGWAHKYNTWEPKENIATDSLLSDFEERLKNGKLLKGQKRSAASSSLSTHKNVLKKRSRGRPVKNTNEDSSKTLKKSSKTIPSLENKSESKAQHINNLKNKSISETDSINAFLKIARRVSRSSSCEQNSQNESVSNSRRSSVASIQGKITRNNSSVDSSLLTLNASPVVQPQNKELKELLRGMPDPYLEVLNDCEMNSSDGSQSLIPFPTLVPKTRDESDYESSSLSIDSNLESNDVNVCEDNNDNGITDPLITNRVNLKPCVVLERLPKLYIKRLTSNNESSDESYEISIKSGDSNDSHSVKSVVHKETNLMNVENVLTQEMQTLNNEDVIEKTAQIIVNNDVNEVVINTLTESSQPIGSQISQELNEDFVEEEVIDNQTVNSEQLKNSEGVMDTEEVVNTEEIETTHTPIDPVIKTISTEGISDKDINISVIETENNVNKSGSELESNNEVILRSNEELVDEEKDPIIEYNQYSPVSEVDIECYTSASINSIEGLSQTSHNIEFAVNDVLFEEKTSSKVEIETQIGPTLEKCAENVEQLSNKEEISRKALNTIESDDKLHDSSLEVDEMQDIRESDLISEELFADTQSQDSQLSEQPRIQWTPQSDYVLREVDQQISYRTEFDPRVESDADSPPLPSPPSITRAQSSPHVPTPPPQSLSPTKRQISTAETLHIDVNQTQNKEKSNEELQTTSAIIVDIILSPSQDSNVETQLSPSSQQKNKEDKGEDRLSPLISSVPKTRDNLVIGESFDCKEGAQPSAPPLPSSPSIRTESVADASNWPLLSQTNHPSHPPMRSSLIFDPRGAPIQPMNYSHPYRPVIQSPQRHIITNDSRIPLPQMSSPNTHVIQRMHSRPQNIPHSQISHQFVQRLPSYPDMCENQILRNNYRQTSAQHFLPSVRPEMHAIRQLSSIRPEFTQTNRQLTPLTDVRMLSRMPTNIQNVAEQRHHSGLDIRHQTVVQLKQTPYQQMRPISGPINHPNIPLSSRSQRMIPYDHRQNSPSHLFNRHLEQRLRGFPSNTSQQSLFPNERMNFIPQPNIPMNPMIRTPYTLEFQKKIVVEPKQSDIREKLKQTHNSPNIALNSRRETLEPCYQSCQRFPYIDNITNKELEVQHILEGRFTRDEFPINCNRTDSVIFGGNKSNQFNVPLNAINRIEDNSSEILQRLLSLGPNEPNIGNKNNYNNAFQSEVQSEERSISRSSSTTPKSLHKDILTEAMEEIVVVFDEKDIESEENIELTITDDIQTNALQSAETPENPTPEDGEFIYIYADENADQLSSDELVEMIKSQGLQVVESDSQEEKKSEQQNDSTQENVNKILSNEEIVIEIDKVLENVESDKTDESNGDLELQLLVINDNDCQSNDNSIDIQISDINDNNNSDEQEWSLVVDDNSPSKSIPIVVQLTESPNDSINEVSVNTESNETQPKDSNNGCDIGTEDVSKSVVLNVDLDEVSKEDSNESSIHVSNNVLKDNSDEVSKEESIDILNDDSMAVEIGENVEIVPNDCSESIEVEDSVQLESSQPTQYVSMPMFSFNQNNSTQEQNVLITNQNSTQNIETIVDINKETEQKSKIEKEIIHNQSEETVKESVNEENISEEKLITNTSSDNTKVVINEDLVNKSVQHPLVSSSVEDLVPKTVAQQTIDVNNDNFLPNSPLSSSEDSQRVIVPTTTIHIIDVEDSDGNNYTIDHKLNDNNSLEVPQNISNNNTIHTIVKDKDSSINVEKINKKRKNKLEISKVPPKKKMSEEEMREFLRLVKTHKNGFERGWTPKEIIGINSLNSTLVFLVKWTNDEQSIILSEVANKKCPQMVIEFYERHINWDSDTD